MILLDSSVLIELFRKTNKQNTKFYRLSQKEKTFAISVITHYEIGVGNKNSTDEFWNHFFNNITVIPFDKECSEMAIEIYLDLRKRNKLIDLADLLIGATALAHGYQFSTLNEKHFKRIKGIDLI